MIKNNTSFQVHNKFELQLFDKDGNLEQTAYAYNEANSQRYTLMGLGLSGNGLPNSDSGFFSRIDLGIGDVQTYKPAKNDSILVSYKFGSNISSFSRITPIETEYKTIEFKSNVITFPEGTTYVGNLTEIGLAAAHEGFQRDNYLFSHAALVDIEGNPIIIEKTQFNILKIQVTIYITPSIKSMSSNLGFKFFPAYATTLGGSSMIYQNGSLSSTLYKDVFPNSSGGSKFYFSSSYVPESKDGIFYNNAMTGVDINRTGSGTYYGGYAITTSGSLAGSNTKGNYSSCFPIKIQAVNKLFNKTDQNFGFAHSIIFPSFGAIPLPNKNIIPEYTIENISIGTGNGEQTWFFTSVNELALDNEGKPKVKIYIQNSETEEKGLMGSDQYVFTNFNIKKSPLWNKLIYIEDNKSTEKIAVNSFRNRVMVVAGRSSTVAIIGSCALTNFCFANNTSDDNMQSQNGYAPSYRYRPVYYDENGITIDEARIGTLYSDSSYSGEGRLGLILSYRNSEEEEWTDINIPAPGTEKFNVVKFEPITAKYWRLQTSNYGTSNSSLWSAQGSDRLGIVGIGSYSNAKTNNVYGIDPNFIVVGNSAVYDFAKVGIEFKTPPPEGAIITMDATLDLPYKTPDNSMTFSYEATLEDPHLIPATASE